MHGNIEYWRCSFTYGYATAMKHQLLKSLKVKAMVLKKDLRRLMNSEWRQIDKRFILQIIVTITFQLIERSLS